MLEFWVTQGVVYENEDSHKEDTDENSEEDDKGEESEEEEKCMDVKVRKMV